MRCFIAVDLESSLKGKIHSLQKQLESRNLNVVDENNLHFTLKFLDDIPENTIKQVQKRLSELASQTFSFPIKLAKIGVFPNEKFIRVVWLGAESKEFLELHLAVNAALADLFEKETPVPHLTLARVKIPDNMLEGFISKNKDIEIGIMNVDCIKLKKSTLTRAGPVYEDLARFELVKK